MPERTKIATCCYCGSRSMLTLAGRVQHHLACSSCGAPLSRMKAIRTEPEGPRPKHARIPRQPASGFPAPRPADEVRRPKRRKPLVKRLLDRIEDAVEDIADLFD